MMTAATRHLTEFVVVGAGAAGLMTARELARAGKRVTILEARDRCGGRIYPLPAQEFGYPAEGGTVDKFSAAFCPVAEFLGGQRVDASAASISRLENRYLLACSRELAGRHQSCGTGADDQNVRQMRGHRQGICVPSAATAF